MIYIDPTEKRKGSRLPEALIKAAKELPGLEERTGADILLSRLSVPPVNDRLLRQHTENGILVQRKSGSDLPSSIIDGRLKESLYRMQEWGSIPWLLVTGVVQESGGLVVVDGRKSIDYGAFTGSLDWWQLRGGSLTLLSDDGKIAWWVSKMLDRLRQAETETVVLKPAVQQMTGDPLTSILSTIPGIGPVKAQAVVKAMQGNKADANLLNALTYLTDERSPKVVGISDDTRKRIAQWVGLEDWTRLSVEIKEDKL